jgi:hypothetical protein
MKVVAFRDRGGAARVIRPWVAAAYRFIGPSVRKLAWRTGSKDGRPIRDEEVDPHPCDASVDHLVHVSLSSPDGRARAAVRAPHSQSAGGQGREFGELHCKLVHAVGSNPVSSASHGNISVCGWRLSAIPAHNSQNRSLETVAGITKARHWRAFPRLLGAISLSAGLAG